MSNAFLNGVTISRSANVSPLSFSSIPEVMSLSGLGKTNPLVDVTSFDSTAREYIAGLADGSEITMECNYLPGNTAQDSIVADVDSGTNFYMQVTATNPNSGNSPNDADTYQFLVTPLSWTFAPSYEDKNMMSFTLKISGDITVS
jgi:hypothetical protein